MKRISWGCVVIGTLSIILSFIGVFIPLDGYKGFNLPFQILNMSLNCGAIGAISGGAIANSKMISFIDILRLPFFDYVFSSILIISGIGTILIKRWGKIFAYIYSISIIFISLISMPVIVIGYIKEFIRISRNPSFMDWIMWGAVLCYIIALLVALVYPIILLIFFSRPRIKEMFGKEESRRL